MTRIVHIAPGILIAGMIVVIAGCVNPTRHRQKADRTTHAILAEKYEAATGRKETLDIERPSDLLRRRLLQDQDLPVSGPASIGSERLDRIEHWPEPDAQTEDGAATTQLPDRPITLSLIEALQVGAQNSSAYQDRKETVFREALSLDLERNAFRSAFFGQLRGLGSYDTTGDKAEGGTVAGAAGSVEKKTLGGTALAAELGVDLANLLTGGGASSLGLVLDTSISIPLMRGAGRHIAAEPLTQAERDVIYAIWEFERYRKEYAVEIVGRYLSVLSRLDELEHSRENYRSVSASAERSRRLAEAGRIKEIEVDQATQNELRARQGWLAARVAYKKALDSFKMLIGLPPDAEIRLLQEHLVGLSTDAVRARGGTDNRNARLESGEDVERPSGDDAAEKEEEARAIRTALDRRLDMKVLYEKIYDAQRAVVVAADRLRTELTFFGSVPFGSRRSSVESARLDSVKLRFNETILSGLLTLNLPFERTAERINYRNKLIDLERSVRDLQRLEDDIKLSVRNTLRDLALARENLRIQTSAVELAEKRVKSVSLFMEAGRAQMRDLLDAQDSLLAARNGLTSAAVRYEMAEIELWRDTETLIITDEGLRKDEER